MNSDAKPVGSPGSPDPPIPPPATTDGGGTTDLPAEPPHTAFNPLTGEPIALAERGEEVGQATARRLARPSSRLDHWAEWFGDRLNPLLVKEVRQALKSRQFAVMFGLLLCFAWGASVIGLAAMGPDAAWEARGPDMFYVYYLALAFALLVIVPYSAFRSLATEQEDHTYELLAITALGPRQIVAGKLASAAMQMLIYLSVLTPCLAFTYLLRGIDLPTIGLVILWTVGGSLVLSAGGLLLGSFSLQRMLQPLVSVGAVIGFAVVFIYACAIVAGLVLGGWLEITSPDFWFVNVAAATIGASYFALFFLAAAAQIAFASDNRSTPLRIVVFVQFLLWTAWFAWFWATHQFAGVILLGYVVVAGSHWYVMGIFFTAESPRLSLRVRRRLPRSFLGRVLFTWFNPGPGTGLMFSLGGALTVWLLAALAAPWASGPWGMAGRDALHLFCGAGISYMAIYLGVEVLALRLLRRFATVRVSTGLVVHLLLVFFGAALPTILAALLYPTYTYGPLHFLNYFYTLFAIAEGTSQPWGASLATFLGGTGAVVLGLNLPGVIREMGQVRIALPARVAEEEQARRPAPPPPASRESPWD